MSSPPDSSAPKRFAVFPRIWWVLGVLLLLGVLGGYFAWHREPRGERPHAPPPPDPRLTYNGEFRNINPEIAYVGDAVCSDCHVEETRSYRDHPMGRSLVAIRDLLQQFPTGGTDAGFSAFRSHFTVERHGERIWHRQTRLYDAGEPLYTSESEVRFAIGSGTRGYSFLSERDGFLFQTPISWFSQKKIWGLSPGFSPAILSGRPIGGECLFCHANRTHPEPDSINAFKTPIFQGLAIGCERCHGPGERHVQERSNAVAVKGPIDFTIFNPSKKKHEERIAPALRDAVCEQCHLSGEARILPRGRELYDFRPGLPLQPFWTILVHDLRPEDKDKAVNHVVQMHLSQCYRKSAGSRKLECVSCHNPHENVSASERVSYYRARCLSCHQRQSPGCALPREQRLLENKDDSCIACHMPRYSATDIPHTAGTDHRIVRHRKPLKEKKEEKLLSNSLKSFYDAEAADPEQARDRAVSLMRLVAEGKADPQRFAQETLALLGKSGAAYPDDIPAQVARGSALRVLGKGAEALAAYELTLQYNPRSEEALIGAARLAQDTGQRGKAIAYWRRAVERNPTAPAYYAALAALLAETGEWEQARDHCRTCLRLDPGSFEARKLLISCLRQLGQRQAAQEEMELLQRLNE